MRLLRVSPAAVLLCPTVGGCLKSMVALPVCGSSFSVFPFPVKSGWTCLSVCMSVCLSVVGGVKCDWVEPAGVRDECMYVCVFVCVCGRGAGGTADRPQGAFFRGGDESRGCSTTLCLRRHCNSLRVSVTSECETFFFFFCCVAVSGGGRKSSEFTQEVGHSHPVLTGALWFICS